MKRFLSVTCFLALALPVQAGLVLQEKHFPRAYDSKLHQPIPARAEWSLVNDPQAAFTLIDLVLWLLAGLLIILLVRGMLRLFRRHNAVSAEPSIDLVAVADKLRKVSVPIWQKTELAVLQFLIWLTKSATFAIRAIAYTVIAAAVVGTIYGFCMGAIEYASLHAEMQTANPAEEVVQISPNLIPHSVE
jgi:hypothetical protein